MLAQRRNHLIAPALLGLMIAAMGLLCALFPAQAQKAHAEEYEAATVAAPSGAAQQDASAAKQAPLSGIAYIRVGKTIIYENKAITQSASDGAKVPRVPKGTKAGSVKGVSFNARTGTLTLSRYSAKALKSYASWPFASGSGHKAHILIAGTADGSASVTVALRGTSTLANPFKCPSTNKPYFIGAERCKITLKGPGTLRTKACNGVKGTGRIWVRSGTYRIDGCGTRGGAFCAQNADILISKAARLYLTGASKKGLDQLIRADKCSNSSASLKRFWGLLCYGATFKAIQDTGGKKASLGTYRVTSKGTQAYGVKLIRYKALSASVGSAQMVSLDRLSNLASTTRRPYVTGIASGAFKVGRANLVRTIALSDRVTQIDKGAFKPLKKLRTLHLRCGANSKLLHCKGGKVTTRGCSSMSAKAFAGISRSCVVTIDYYNKGKPSRTGIATKCKRLLVKKGLPKSVKMRVNLSYRSCWGEAYAQATPLGKRIVAAARVTPSPGANLCAKWVSQVYARAGLGYPNGDACDFYREWCLSSDCRELVVGMTIGVPTHDSSGYFGRTYGHVGIYIGDNRVMHLQNGVRVDSLSKWTSVYGSRAKPRWGFPPK